MATPTALRGVDLRLFFAPVITHHPPPPVIANVYETIAPDACGFYDDQPINFCCVGPVTVRNHSVATMPRGNLAPFL
jgi:hypothetical protein